MGFVEIRRPSDVHLSLRTLGSWSNCNESKHEHYNEPLHRFHEVLLNSNRAVR
jgi:hypothetical protein